MENLLKNEIIRKLSGLNFATIDLNNGGHTSMLHVGLSNEELLRRRKHDSVGNVSTFEDVNIFDVCIYTFINDNIEVRVHNSIPGEMLQSLYKYPVFPGS